MRKATHRPGQRESIASQIMQNVGHDSVFLDLVDRTPVLSPFWMDFMGKPLASVRDLFDVIVACERDGEMNRTRETLDLRTLNNLFIAVADIPLKSVYAVERRIRAELGCYRLWPDSNLAVLGTAHELFCGFRYLEGSRGVDFFQ